MTKLPPITEYDDTPFFLKKWNKTAYLHKPPAIKPNYGKKREDLLPKTKICRILLYDNTTQQHLLDTKVKYYEERKKMIRWATEKNKDAFIQLQSRRAKWHEIMASRYQAMKDEFIAHYGTRYMPVPTPEPEIDPFLINARLAPPLNVLCFYLDQKPVDEEQDWKLHLKKRRRERTLVKAPKPTTQTLNMDTDRLICSLQKTVGNTGYVRSIEDPRFRSLQESLHPLDFPNDGYLQLSPNYIKGKVPKAVRLPFHKRVKLPEFYRKAMGIPKVSDQLEGPQDDQEEQSSKRDSLGSLSLSSTVSLALSGEESKPKKTESISTESK